MMANLNLFLFRKLQYLNVWVFFLKEAHPLQDHQHFLRLKWLLRNRKKAQSSKDLVLHKVIAKKKKVKMGFSVSHKVQKVGREPESINSTEKHQCV